MQVSEGGKRSIYNELLYFVQTSDKWSWVREIRQKLSFSIAYVVYVTFIC